MSDCKYCVPGRTCPGCIARKIKVLPAAPVERGEPDKVREALAAIEKAHEMVSALCSGERRWTMSIPARPDDDPDIVISRALRLAGEAIALRAAPSGEASLVAVRNAILRVMASSHDERVETSEVLSRLDSEVMPLVAALTAAPSGEAEPVAWGRKLNDWPIATDFLRYTEQEAKDAIARLPFPADESAAIPLYTHPAAPQVTDEMVEAGVQGWAQWENNGREDDETVSGMVRAILDAALTP